MKIINASLHGVLDYVTVSLFILAPLVLEFSELPKIIAFSLAIVHLTMTLLTNFRLGLFKLVPFSLHGWVERIVGPLLIVGAFSLNFEGIILKFYVAMGAIIILVGVMSDYSTKKINQ